MSAERLQAAELERLMEAALRASGATPRMAAATARALPTKTERLEPTGTH